MFLGLLAWLMIRVMYWTVMTAAIIVLTTAAGFGVIAAGIIGLFNEQHGELCHEAAVLLINGAIGIAQVAEGRR